MALPRCRVFANTTPDGAILGL